MKRTHLLVLATSTALTGCAHNYVLWHPQEHAITNHRDALDEAANSKRSDARLAKEFLDDWEELWEPEDEQDQVPQPAAGQGHLKQKQVSYAFAKKQLGKLERHMFRIKAAPPAADIEARGGNADHWHRTAAYVNDARLDAFYGEEYKAIEEAFGSTYRQRIGLALSGGGLRSASFATGVLQGLHEIGVLDDVGYLSTVSGGGWAGYWYMSHEEPADALLLPGSNHLTRLSESGNFLAEGNYSKSSTDLIKKLVCHVSNLPLHWLFSGIIDTDYNIWGVRDFFRLALHETYAYGSAVGDWKWEPPQPMRCYKPMESANNSTKPFWIVNMHVALQDEVEAHRNRSGDSFEITPLRAGSDATGYVETTSNPKRSTDWMYADRVVAISSAAVDSRSLKSGYLINSLTQFFNFDLGYYVDSWHYDWLYDWSAFTHSARFWFGAPAPFFYWLGMIPGLDWFFSTELHTENLKAKRYRLTDGGHFDNTGIYSLIRRGCRLIIVSDGTRDLATNDWDNADNQQRASMFEDFRELQKLVKADFGAEICVNWESFSVSDPQRKIDDRFRKNPHSHVLIGTIKNLPILDKDLSDKNATNDEIIDDEVKIVLIKSAYSLDEQLINQNSYVDLEKSRNPDYSHDSTANVGYSERRVLSYRELGRQSARSARKILDDTIKTIRARH